MLWKIGRRILPKNKVAHGMKRNSLSRVIEYYACAGDQFLAGTKNIWWLSFCVDPLPVAGHVVLMRESLARFSGRFLSLYTCPMLCFSTGPSFKITETSMSCVPPHLLQRAKILYLVGDIVSFMPSFSRMVVPYCFGVSIKMFNPSTPVAYITEFHPSFHINLV